MPKYIMEVTLCRLISKQKVSGNKNTCCTIHHGNTKPLSMISLCTTWKQWVAIHSRPNCHLLLFSFHTQGEVTVELPFPVCHFVDMYDGNVRTLRVTLQTGRQKWTLSQCVVYKTINESSVQSDSLLLRTWQHWTILIKSTILIEKCHNLHK